MTDLGACVDVGDVGSHALSAYYIVQAQLAHQRVPIEYECFSLKLLKV